MAKKRKPLVYHVRGGGVHGGSLRRVEAHTAGERFWGWFHIIMVCFFTVTGLACAAYVMLAVLPGLLLLIGIPYLIHRMKGED